MCKVHSHKMAVLANQTIGDCPGSSPHGCPAASLPLLSLARQGGISPRSNTCSRRRKSFRRDAPSHWGVRRHTRLETPVWEDKEPSERRTWLQECRRSRVRCQSGWKPSAARRVCAECVAQAWPAPGSLRSGRAQAPQAGAPRGRAGHQLGIGRAQLSAPVRGDRAACLHEESYGNFF